MNRSSVPKTARGERSRKAILETTATLIAELGGNHVTLDQIAEHCGIAKSSIMWHFGSKDELLLEMVDSTYRHFAQTLISQHTTEMTTLEKVTLLLNAYSSVSVDRPEIPAIFYSFAFSNKKQTKIRDKILEIYEWNRQAFMEHFGISENLAAMLVGMVNGILVQWLTDPDRFPIQVLLQEMIPVFNRLIEDENALKRRSR